MAPQSPHLDHHRATQRTLLTRRLELHFESGQTILCSAENASDKGLYAHTGSLPSSSFLGQYGSGHLFVENDFLVVPFKVVRLDKEGLGLALLDDESQTKISLIWDSSPGTTLTEPRMFH